MPSLPTRPCLVPGCGQLIGGRHGAYCTRHAPKSALQATYDRLRGTAHQRGYGVAWRKQRAAFLRDNALCVHCESNGIIRAATEVDHIKPHRGDMTLFWDASNWQALCKSCHSAKTLRESAQLPALLLPARMRIRGVPQL